MPDLNQTGSPVEILQRYFGYQSFRPGQEEIIRSVVSGGDNLVVMPTGGGKSICYQIPALMLPGVTVVVSPLIALMKDQVDALKRHSVGATTINSTLSFNEVSQRLNNLRYGQYSLIYVAPERFESKRFIELMQQIDVSLFAVDEAHCISEWGHDFRPSYLRLQESIETIGRPPVVALTATATPYVQEDIVKQLGLRKLRRFVKGFDRPNLNWGVLTPSDKNAELRKRIEQDLRKDGVCIVYCGTRRRVEEVGTSLHAEGVPVTIYHAGLPDNDRRKAQDAFINGQARVIVATNAFGMGIDKANVRGVYHVDMPGSVEAYYQEGGRAGRDGKPARCVLLWSSRDRGLQEFFIRNSFPDRETVEHVYNALWDSLQVGMGSKYEGVMVPNMNKIASRARIHPASLHGVFSILQKNEVIEQVRSDRLAIVRFTAEGNEIKQFYNVTRDEIRKKTLMGLLRVIGGAALTHETLFSPDQVAKQAELSREEFERGMKGLTMARLLVYTPPTSRGGIRFLQERLPSRNLRIDEAKIQTERSRSLQRLEAMERYARTRSCRRDFILEYFGAEAEPEPCGRCDNCLNGYAAQAVPGSTGQHLTQHDQHAIDNILGAVAELGGRFGKMTVVDFLLGRPSKTINSFGLDHHGRYGALKGEDRSELSRIADRLMGEGLLQQTAGMKPLIKLTAAGHTATNGLPLQPFSPAAPPLERTGHPDLLKKLMAERDLIADRDGFTQHSVCENSVLVRISNRVPSNKSELLATRGFGQENFDRCGTSLLRVIDEYRSHLETDSRALTLPIRLRQTFELIEQGYEMEQIAQQSARQPSTISSHIEELIKSGVLTDVSRFVSDGILKRVAEELENRPYATLRELRALTGNAIDFPELRIAAAWIRFGKKLEV